MGSPFKSKEANDRAARMSQGMRAQQDEGSMFKNLLSMFSRENAQKNMADPKPTRDIVIPQPDPEAEANSRLNPIPDVLPVDVYGRAGLAPEQEKPFSDMNEQEQDEVLARKTAYLEQLKRREGGMR
jgi:hypothetical protein